MAQAEINSNNDLYVQDVKVWYATYIADPTDDSETDITSATWASLGALTEAGKESQRETAEPPAMNVVHSQIVTKEQTNISLTLQEINPTTLDVLMAGLIQTTTTAGTLVSDATQAIVSGSWAFNQFIPFENQNGDASTIAVTSIIAEYTGDTPATPYTLEAGTDYYLGTNDSGLYGVYIVATSDVSELAQGIAVIYSYTPNASKTVWEGGADSIDPFMLRFSSVQGDGRTIEVYFPRCEYSSGGQITDKDKNSEEYKEMPFNFVAKEHESYTQNGRKVLSFTKYID